MDAVNLIPPDDSMEIAVLEFVQEFLERNETTVFGSVLLDTGLVSYREWLKALSLCDKKNHIPSIRETCVFVAKNTEDVIVGIGCIRRKIQYDDYLRGDIEFSVRPSMRNKGAATEILRQLLNIAALQGRKSVMLLCSQGNEAARKTILKCGGKPPRIAPYEETEKETYVIELS